MNVICQLIFSFTSHQFFTSKTRGEQRERRRIRRRLDLRPNWGNRSPSRSCLLFRIMSSSSSYYKGKNEVKKGVNNTQKLVYIPMECRCGMRAEIKIVEVNPDTRGELYYSCYKPVREMCGFFKGCLPVGWPTIGNIGGWVSNEPTRASATTNSDDVVAHEREVMMLRQQLDHCHLLTKGLITCLLLAIVVIIFK
ncbi:uncharacterized protein LOC131300567 [Rhododendron vialii]|uniref:uncharacterized protein LOC131300567 n=1 Tax=Rhododendron vialii TaxID=182163 RepID=UPI00265EC006|nr:uncharacterized protein LOC131300567 [Rhododendron vialii]